MDQKSPNNVLLNKIVWITGASSGIGKATALALGAVGARVIVTSRTQKDIDKVTGEIIKNGGTAISGCCDITKKGEIERLVNTIVKTWGEINILINGAGLWAFNEITDISEHEWDMQLDTNLKATFLCTQAVLKGMKINKNGHIINIISIAGEQPFNNCTAYCASKYGALGFTEALRLETRELGIKVTAVLPGATDTPGWKNTDLDRGKMLSPASVAEAIVNVCSLPDDCMAEKIVLRPQGGDL